MTAGRFASACAIVVALLAAPLPGGGGGAAFAATTGAAPVQSPWSGLLSDDFDERLAALGAIVSAPDASTPRLIDALLADSLRVDAQGRPLIVAPDGSLTDARGVAVSPPAAAPEPVTINNRMRARLQSAQAGLRLSSPERAVRLAAVASLQHSVDDELLPSIERALATERDAEIRSLLALAAATVHVRSDDPARRLAAVRALADSDQPQVRALLLRTIARDADGVPLEPSEAVREAARASLAEVEARLERAEWIGRVFAGLSLGSVLMLAAIGLAITYGLLGVINMAHGEMIMIGAYAAFMTQAAFRTWAPQWFDWYPLAALPIAFIAAGAVGVALERTVIRWLYGRPLETLLATWGISLMLIQAVRQLFGPQNVEIENPSWLSGGLRLAGAVLPFNRIAIIVFALVVVAIVALVLNRTRLGLFVRGVTQNRPIAAAIGVPTARVDMLAFGLGSAIAGLAGVALSQIGNVGPDLGQAYVIDSFIVVVLGGVGQIAGTVLAGFGLGVANKMLEPWFGAVIAKIAILALIIVFIQKRPQGLFALKGRAVEA